MLQYAKAASSVFDAAEGGSDVGNFNPEASSPESQRGQLSPSPKNSTRSLLTPRSPLKSPILKVRRRVFQMLNSLPFLTS